MILFLGTALPLFVAGAGETPLLRESFESAEEIKANGAKDVPDSIEFTDGLRGKGISVAWGGFRNVSGEPVGEIVSMGFGASRKGRFTLTFPRDLDHVVVTGADTNFTFEGEGKEVPIVNDNRTANTNVLQNLLIKFNAGSTNDRAVVTAVVPRGILYPAKGRINKDEFTVEFLVKHPLDLSAYHVCQLNYFEAVDGKNSILLMKRAGTESIVYSVSNREGKYLGGSWDRMTSKNCYWAAGTWHHIAITGSRSAEKAALYVDGELLASAEGTEFPDSLAGDIRIASGNGRYPINGVMDELTIMGRAKTAEEIKKQGAK